MRKEIRSSQQIENIFQQTFGVSIEKINISLPKDSSKRETKANYRNNLYRNKLNKNDHIYLSESMVYCRKATFIETSIPLT